MTEDQTNQLSQPADSGKGNDQNVSRTPRRRGHFASDGFALRRAAPAAPHIGAPSSGIASSTPSAEPSAAPPIAEPVVAPAAPPKRFDLGNKEPVAPKQPKQPTSGPSVSVTAPIRRPIDAAFERTRFFLLMLFLAPLCFWASRPSWESMVYEWYHTADYSHGFLVIPATLLFLFLRRDTYPGTRYKLDWIGLFPILIYGMCRIFAGIRYMDALDAVTIWFWILGVVWFFYGWRVFLWALPSLCFLIFMFQLPYSIDVLMKNRLQLFAAYSAATMLQTIGIAAIPIANTIRLSSQELGVEAACSGLRFLMSVFAIALAAVLLLRRPWWQNVLIMAIAAPLALFVNAVRIAITGVLLERHFEVVSAWAGEGKLVSVVADEFAGKVAIFLALGLFALFVWYLGKVFRRVEI